MKYEAASANSHTSTLIRTGLGLMLLIQDWYRCYRSKQIPDHHHLSLSSVLVLLNVSSPKQEFFLLLVWRKGPAESFYTLFITSCFFT